jgi:hypothetical protein
MQRAAARRAGAASGAAASRLEQASFRRCSFASGAGGVTRQTTAATRRRSSASARGDERVRGKALVGGGASHASLWAIASVAFGDIVGAGRATGACPPVERQRAVKSLLNPVGNIASSRREAKRVSAAAVLPPVGLECWDRQRRVGRIRNSADDRCGRGPEKGPNRFDAAASALNEEAGVSQPPYGCRHADVR